MSSNFPNLFDGQPLKQTTKRTVHIGCGTYRFMDMSQMRYVDTVPVARFDGTYNTLFALDYIGGGPGRSLQDFHDAMLGRFNQFTLTFNGNTYNNCWFDIERITFQEKAFNWYTSEVKLKQFPDTVFPTITVSDPSLPTLGDGTGGPQNQYPNPLYHTESNVIVDLDAATRYAYHRIDSPIAGGSLELKTITPAEAAIFEAFFIQMGGMYGIFTLNYNGIAYVNCHFTTTDLVIDYSQDPGACSLSLPWEAVPVSGVAPPTPTPTPTSAVLTITTSQTETPSTPYSVSLVSANGVIALSGVILNLNTLNGGGAWGSTANTSGNIQGGGYSSLLNYGAGFTLDVYQGVGFGIPSGPIVLQVYGASIALIMPDLSTATVTPHTASILYGPVSPSSLTDFISNPGNAVDGSPSTYATIQRQSVVSDYPVLVLSDWS